MWSNAPFQTHHLSQESPRHSLAWRPRTADCASRGILSMPPQPLLASGGTLELKAVCLASIPVPPAWIEETFSSYHTLIHVNAWCIWFVTNLRASVRKQPKCTTPHLTATEINMSEHALFHRAQSQTFSHELNQLTHDHPIKSSSAMWGED